MMHFSGASWEIRTDSSTEMVCYSFDLGKKMDSAGIVFHLKPRPKAYSQVIILTFVQSDCVIKIKICFPREKMVERETKHTAEHSQSHTNGITNNYRLLSKGV